MNSVRRVRLLTLSGIAIFGLTSLNFGGCAPVAVPGDANIVGLAAGGQQDIARARESIEAGYLPDPANVTVEGFLAEHDIPLPRPETAAEIFASSGVAWRKPFGESAAIADVFVRLGTTIDTSNFKRAAQNLCVLVDRSGSMKSSASSNDYRPKLEAVQEALHSLVNQLDAGDQLSIVIFDDKADVHLGPTGGDNFARMHEKIDQIEARGDTNLYAAIELGFQTLAESSGDGRVNRLIVFTDAVPTVGPLGSAEFLDLQRSYAQQGFGFTLMGVGVDFGDALARDISSVRGGNSFYLSDSSRIAQVFNEEFDYFVTPAAYDLELRVAVPAGVGIREVYGVPDYLPGASSAVIRIPTLFFSAREGGGAIVVRLTFAIAPTFEQPVVLGQATMAYTLATGEQRNLGQELTLPIGLAATGDPAYYSDEAVRRAALLLDTATVIQSAAKAGRDGRRSDGAALIRNFLAEFSTRSAGMSDRTDATSRGLSDERALLERLQGVLQNGYYYGYPY